MSKAQHTEGPWEVVGPKPRETGGNQVSIHAVYYGSVATVWNERDKLPDEETMANAHLIAAAPMMLAALKEAIPILEGYLFKLEQAEQTTEMVGKINRLACQIQNAYGILEMAEMRHYVETEQAVGEKW